MFIYMFNVENMIYNVYEQHNTHTKSDRCRQTPLPPSRGHPPFVVHVGIKSAIVRKPFIRRPGGLRLGT